MAVVWHPLSPRTPYWGHQDPWHVGISVSDGSIFVAVAVGSRSEKDGTGDSLIGGAFVRRAASTLASRRCAARDGGVFFAPPLLRGGPGDPNGGGGEGGGGFHGAGWYGGPPQGWCAVRRVQAAASVAEGTGTHGISGFSLGGGMVPDLKQCWYVLAVGVKGRGLGWSCRCGRP
jgi:hypothetical protein